MWLRAAVVSEASISGVGNDRPWKPARHREPRDQVAQADGVAVVLAGVEALERALQPEGGQGGGRAVAGANDVDHVDVVVADEQVEVRPDEHEAGTRAPVACSEVSSCTTTAQRRGRLGMRRGTENHHTQKPRFDMGNL